MPPHDDLELHGLFTCEVDVAALAARLRQAGVPDGGIQVLSPLPLSSRASARVLGIPLYAVTIAAGVVGIGVGVFFAAGTALLYPLMTGGKPIVAAPVVGIISYETMMLLAIVVTFLTTVISITRTNATIRSRDARIDEGRLAVVVRVPMLGPVAGDVQDAMERAGALDVRLSVIPGGEEPATGTARQAASVLMPLVFAGALAGCSQDMQEQPSYQAQEEPRRHSPPGSVPRKSRQVVPLSAPAGREGNAGERLFHINCAHCHGATGHGDGPVAPFLKERPADLRGDEVRAMSEETIYRVVTEGKDMMPSFRGELSAEDRLLVARFVRAFSSPPAARREREGG